MSDVIRKRLSESLGKVVKLFLYNGFYYTGKLTNYDNIYIEILDFKTKSHIIKKIDDLRNIEVKG